MSNKITSTYTNPLTLVADCFVPSEDYTKLHGQILEQSLANVEVDGFRKGKAPIDKAMAKLDLQRMESQVASEAINHNYPEVAREVEELLKKDERRAMGYGIDYNADVTKINDDGSFQFRVLFSLLPKVDISGIEGAKITPTEQTARLSREEFIAKEEANLIKSYTTYSVADVKTAIGTKINLDIAETYNGETSQNSGVDAILGAEQLPPALEEELIGLSKGESKEFELSIQGQDFGFAVTINEISTPDFATMHELVASENGAQIADEFGGMEGLHSTINAIYDQETNFLQEEAKRRAVIKESIKIIPDFEMETDTIDAEVNRIMTGVKSEAENRKISLSEEFAVSGIPNSAPNMDEATILETITNYVTNEFKFSNIVKYIYYTGEGIEAINEVDTKHIVDKMKANPSGYQLTGQETQEQLENLGFDKLMRQKAIEWMMSKVEFVA